MKRILSLIVGISAAVCVEKLGHAESTSTPSGTTEPEVIGYAWPRTDLLITNSTPVAFKRLKNGGKYRLIAKLETGYSIVAPKTDGQEAMAFMPLRDRLGNSITVNMDGEWITVSCSRVILDTLDWLDLKPGVVPLSAGGKYPVLENAGSALMLRFASAVLTQDIQVTAAEVDYISVADYQKAIDSALAELKKQAERQLADKDYDRDRIAVIFTKYDGRFAESTVEIREELAADYRFKATRAKREFEAEQLAKGLVDYGGEWMTPQEADRRRETSRVEEERRREIGRQQEERERARKEALWAERNRQEGLIRSRAQSGTATYAEYAQVLKGKTKSEVIALLGRPGDVYDDGQEWIYRNLVVTVAEGKDAMWIGFSGNEVSYFRIGVGGSRIHP